MDGKDPVKDKIIIWQHPDLDIVRNNLRDVKHWIEQAEQSLYDSPDEAHFKISIKFAKKQLNKCK